MVIHPRVRGFVSRKDVFFVTITASLLLLIILIQQLLPSDQVIPFARVNGELTRLSNKDDLLKTYRIKDNQSLTLRVGDYKANYKVKDLGVSLDESATTSPYLPESRAKRMIPFSLLAQIYRDNQPVYVSNQKSLVIVTNAIADQVNVDPVNATITTSTSAPQIKPSEQGVKFSPGSAALSILEAFAGGQDEVVLARKVTDPEITTAELESSIEAFLPSLPEKIQLSIGTQQTVVAKSDLYQWLDYQIVAGKPEITLSPDKVSEYAAVLNTEFVASAQPTATLVSLLDGKEVGRIQGKDGKSIDVASLSASLLGAVKDKQTVVTAKLVDVPSPIRYARSYSRSSEGLKEMLGAITTGKEISVRFIDINSRGWDVGSRADTKSYMASTYKMFVVYSTLKRIEEGSMKFTDTINGKTLDTCMQTIIIDSDNDCAIAIAERIGWIKIQNEGKALGATGLDWRQELSGTVSDASVIPAKLARGEILTETDRNYMLDLMKRQRFRSGIPAGTTHIVANKVGFFEGWLNDAGIVYAGDMPYVLAIYTKGQSWGTIAEITRQIESLVR